MLWRSSSRFHTIAFVWYGFEESNVMKREFWNQISDRGWIFSKTCGGSEFPNWHRQSVIWCLLGAPSCFEIDRRLEERCRTIRVYYQNGSSRSDSFGENYQNGLGRSDSNRRCDFTSCRLALELWNSDTASVGWSINSSYNRLGFWGSRNTIL